jgi:hypothetical protein
VSTEEVLAVIEQKIGQAVGIIHGEPPLYSPEFLLTYVLTQNYELTTLGVTTGVTVYSGSISPDPSTPIGMLLAYGAAAALVSDDLVNRLKGGELGLSFSTGATSISTIQAASTLKNFAAGLVRWKDILLTAYLSGDPNSVITRIT